MTPYELYSAGRKEEAARAFEAAYDASCDPMDLYNAACCWRDEKEYKRAADLGEKALRRLHDEQRDDSDDALKIREAYVFDLECLGRYEEAAKERGKILKKKQGKEAAKELIFRSTDYREAGKIEEALADAKEAFSLYVKLLGPASVEAMTSLLSAAACERLLSNYQEAREYDYGAWTGLKAALGEEHALTQSAAVNLALDDEGLGRRGEAKTLLDKVIKKSTDPDLKAFAEQALSRIRGEDGT